MSHTPTPWKLITGRQDRMTMGWSPSALVGVFNAGYDTKIKAGQAEEEANAAFIVQAVNSHAALVEALNGMLNAYPQTVGGTGQVEARDKARALVDQLSRNA